MSCNTTSYVLGDLVELSQGLAINVKTKHVLSESGLPLLRIADLISRQYCQFVNPELAPKKCLAVKGDLIYTRTGQVGLVFRDQAGVIHNNSFKVIPDESKVRKDFLYWFLSQNKIKALANDIASGSVQKDLNHSAFKSIAIELPDFDAQDRAIKTLDSIDQKITLNTQTNQTLEQMAQAIFKSWFVDFDPVKAKMKGEQPEGMDAATVSLFPEKLVESELGLIPEGWEVGELSDLMDFNPKRTLKKGTVAPYLDMKNMPTAGHLALDIYDREMGSGTKFVNGDALLARITPCLENGKTAFVDFLEDEQVGWGSTEYIVMRSKSDSYKYFSYFMARFEPFRKFAIQSMTGTSGRQRAQAKTVQTMPFVIPPLSILEKFDELIAANMKLIKRHGDENKTLADLRDTLLPKLLSGEIELVEQS